MSLLLFLSFLSTALLLPPFLSPIPLSSPPSLLSFLLSKFPTCRFLSSPSFWLFHAPGVLIFFVRRPLQANMGQQLA